MNRQRLAERVEDGHARIERGARVLQHQLRPCGASRAGRPRRGSTATRRRSSPRRRWRPQQPDDEPRQRTLAGSGFAHDREAGSARDPERDPVDRPHHGERPAHETAAPAAEMPADLATIMMSSEDASVRTGAGKGAFIAAPPRRTRRPPSARQRCVPPARPTTHSARARVRWQRARKAQPPEGSRPSAARPRSCAAAGRGPLPRPARRREALACRDGAALAKHGCDIAALDDPASIHHRHVVGETGDQIEIVGHNQNGHAALLLELAQQRRGSAAGS